MSNQLLNNSGGSLSIGNVVSAGLRIYKDHFKAYLGVSFKASLWAVFPFIVIFILGIIAAILIVVGGENPLICFLIWLISLLSVIVVGYFLIYCVGKSLTNSALISRLAYQELTNKPDSVSATFSQIRSKNWLFWRTQFLTALILWLISWGLQIIQFILFGLPVKLINNQLISFLIDLIGSLVYLGAYTWFVARYFIPEVPLAIEQNLNASLAINRSWTLTKGFAGKILLIISVAILITIPVYLLAMIPLGVGFSIIIPMVQEPSSIESTKVILIGGLSFLIAIVFFIFLNILALPFWQSIKAVIYYELRSRREGMGLQIRDT